jgi:predicted SAM-dependent methyltransferase
MKLHLGCGKRFLPGWTHVDVSPHPHIDIVGDVGDLHMLSEGSVEAIYASHVLEHFHREQVLPVLKEWCRVLVPEGVIHVAVPNFTAVVHQFLRGGDVEDLQGLLYGGQDYPHNFHHVAFTWTNLCAYLNKAGFKDITHYRWEDFLPEGFDDYSRAYIPHMDFKAGMLMSLNLTAKKA